MFVRVVPCGLVGWRNETTQCIAGSSNLQVTGITQFFVELLVVRLMYRQCFFLILLPIIYPMNWRVIWFIKSILGKANLDTVDVLRLQMRGILQNEGQSNDSNTERRDQ